jgi:hypothetical protein
LTVAPGPVSTFLSPPMSQLDSVWSGSASTLHFILFIYLYFYGTEV